MLAKNKKLGWFPFVVSGLSFIPLVGVPIGFICMVYGSMKKSIVLFLIGLGGIAFTASIYNYLFLQLKNPTGVHFELASKLHSQTIMPRIVKDIEFYKIQYGRYPKSLAELKSQDVVVNSAVMKSLGQLFYSLDPDGAHYYLLMTGPDGKPFTADDILPDMSPNEIKNFGLRIKSPVSHN